MQRLRTKWQSDQLAYNLITDIALVEKQKGEHKGSRSCAKGLLWLTRQAPVPRLDTNYQQHIARLGSRGGSYSLHVQRWRSQTP